MEVNNMKNEENDELKVANLSEKLEILENEKKKLSDEFNVQRAKMKELFLQKEEEFNNEKSRLLEELQKLKDELDDTRSQLVIAGIKLESDLENEKRKAQEEIATLQQLVHETVEESSSSRSLFDSELKKLNQVIQHLQEENKELKTLGQQSSPHHSIQESTNLGASVVLSAVTKTLAKKFGADTFGNQDNLEESMRKAQEDAEMLRSLVVPLEEEIKALKDKLRSTDDQLQKCKLCGHNTESDHQRNEAKIQQDSSQNTNDDPSTAAQNLSGKDEKEEETACDMCSNYEAQLVREQQRNCELETKLAAAEKAMDRHKEDLLKEIGFRKDMEEKWNEKKEEHKLQVHELNIRTLCLEQDLKDLRQSFDQYCKDIKKQLESLTKEREQVHEHLTILQNENDKLVGKFSIHSQQLESEDINFPDTVADLQEKLLKLRHDLIIAKVGQEAALEKQQSLDSAVVILRDQLTEREKLETVLRNQIEQGRKQIEHLHKEKEQLSTLQERYKLLEQQFQEQTNAYKGLEEKNKELRSQISSLHTVLDNSEEVKKDFVHLSQSLQVELERIRGSDTQVRWQHEDDVVECPTCHTALFNSKEKQHCLHCGHIFCADCLGHVVLSGPKQRPAKVCDVCHTLLVKTSAPYFSAEAPRSPY